MDPVSRRQVLVAAGAFTLGLAGCGSGGGSSKSGTGSANRTGAMASYAVGDQFKATEPLTFSMLYYNNPNYPIKQDWLFWSELAKRTNVSLQNTVVPLSDYTQKRSLMIGAGNAPFIIPKTYPGQETPFVSGGAILPVSDYVDLMPNFKDKVAKWNLEADLDSIRQADGKYYVLPGLHQDVWVDYSLAMRTDILQRLNLAVPQTWDEVHSTLTAMKTLLPNSYPFSDRWSHANQFPAGSLLNILGQAYGTAAGWGYQDYNWDSGAGQFAFTGAMDQYRQVLQYLNTLVAEKLLDPESFTQQDDAARQKFATGKSFVISCNAQTLVNECRLDMAKLSPTATVVKIPVPIGPAGAVKQGSRLENGIMISTKAKDSKNFVAMMQFIDWLWYSDKGEEFAKWGVEGVTYTKDSAGNYTLAPDVNYVGLNPKGTKHLQVDFGFTNGVFAYGGTTKLLESTFSPEEQAFQKVMTARKTLPVPPPHPYTGDEQEQATLWETPLTDYVTQQSLRFILGQRPLGDWSNYQAELKGKNMTQYIDLVNKAYQRYHKDHG
jgi:putative aldouronate transport system substrate-binding protein